MSPYKLCVLCLGCLFFGCAPQIPFSSSSSPTTTINTAWHTIFDEWKVENGTVVLYNLAENKLTIYNESRSKTAFLPASTFKIFNSLATLETGVLQDTTTVIPWNGVTRDIASWNQDQTLRTAFQRSAVWVYEKWGSEVGNERMASLMTVANYGNQKVTGTYPYWLRGDLRISAREQVDFLVKLYHNKLPFSKATIDIVKSIMILEQIPTYTLRGKTGWAIPDGVNIGWMVGYLEQNQKVYFFALNLESNNPDFPMIPARLAILREILKTQNLL